MPLPLFVYTQCCAIVLCILEPLFENCVVAAAPSPLAVSFAVRRYRIKNAFKINPVQLSWLSEWAYQLSPLTRITIKGSIALPSMAQLAQIRTHKNLLLFPGLFSL